MIKNKSFAFIDATAIIGSVYIVGSPLIPLIAGRSVSLLRFLASVQVFYPESKHSVEIECRKVGVCLWSAGAARLQV